MLKVGFSGTQQGMTPNQKTQFLVLMSKIRNTDNDVEFHHGCCIGSDEDAVMLLRNHYFEWPEIVCHPAGFAIKASELGLVIPPTKFSSIAYSNSNRTLDGFTDDFLTRNRKLAKQCDFCITTPAQPNEVIRSGTWTTKRYFVNLNKVIVVIYPDGTVSGRDAMVALLNGRLASSLAGTRTA